MAKDKQVIDLKQRLNGALLEIQNIKEANADLNTEVRALRQSFLAAVIAAGNELRITDKQLMDAFDVKLEVQRLELEDATVYTTRRKPKIITE